MRPSTLLKDLKEESGDCGVDQEEQNNCGGCCPIAHGSPVAPMDYFPHEKAGKEERNRKEEVNEEVHIRARKSAES